MSSPLDADGRSHNGLRLNYSESQLLGVVIRQATRRGRRERLDPAAIATLDLLEERVRRHFFREIFTAPGHDPELAAANPDLREAGQEREASDA
jgi:hypothetical protein